MCSKVIYSFSENLVTQMLNLRRALFIGLGLHMMQTGSMFLFLFPVPEQKHCCT